MLCMAMVTMQIREHSALPHGHALVAKRVVPRHVAGAAVPFEGVAAIGDGRAVQQGLDTVAVASMHSSPFVI